MQEEKKTKRELLQELGALRSRVAQLEQVKHKRKDKKLKQSEKTFKSIFDDMAEGMLLTDVEKKQFVAGNKAICQILGCNPEEITNLRVTDIHPQEDLAYVIEQFEKQARGELTLSKDIPVKRKNGSIFYADINSFPIRLAGKTYLMGVFRETSGRKGKSISPRSTPTYSYTGKPLTASEMRVLRLIVTGMSNKKIARSLHRSVRTIEGHRAHLMQKLGVDNSVDLVRRAALMGLVLLPVEQRRDKAT